MVRQIQGKTSCRTGERHEASSKIGLVEIVKKKIGPNKLVAVGALSPSNVIEKVEVPATYTRLTSSVEFMLVRKSQMLM
jgi:hypothetical protein